MAKRKYQLWWADDRGKRLQRLDQFSFLNYSRIVNGQGTANVGLPFETYGDIYRKDYRLEVWRAPELRHKRRLENVFSMQEGIIRTRQTDDVTILDMTGHDPPGMLNRRIVKYFAGESESTKTNNIDDMMKEIVDENFGAAALADDAARAIPYDDGFFRIQADASLGASVTKSFSYRNVLDILKELHNMSHTNTPRIYFDVVPVTPTIWEFQTFQNQRGGDKRFSAGESSFLFSIERGNLEAPQYERDSFEEKNVAYAGGQGVNVAREVEERSDAALETASLWGRREVFKDARNETTTAGVQAAGDEELGFRRPEERFVANLLDTKGSRYGKDWDFGNLHTVNYGGRQFDIEIKIVYVRVEDDGSEKIFGRNEFGEF
jgi:hypothetical protein